MSKKRIDVYDGIFQNKLEKIVAKLKKLRKCCPKQAKEQIKKLIQEAKDIKKSIK